MARKRSTRRSGPTPGKHPSAMGNRPRVPIAPGIGRVPPGANISGGKTKPPFVGGPTT